MEMLAKSLVIAEEESLAISERSTKGCTKLIALEGWSGTPIKIVGSVERAVSQKFVYAAVKVIGSGLSHDSDLSTGALAVLGAVGIAQHIEFAHCVYAEQLLTASAGLHVVFRRAGEFHPVEQENVLLWTIA